MRKNSTKRVVLLGVVCALLMAAAVWYSVTYNDARLVEPMVLSEYSFRMRDLPMLAAGALTGAYAVYLLVLMIAAVVRQMRGGQGAKYTRAVSPKLGFLGFCGFAGFLGFWTYSVNKTIFPFIFFMFFGFFGFFYEGKLSNTFMDERYKENHIRAHAKANQIALGVIFLSTLVLGQGSLMGNLEYTLIALLIAVSLAIALEMFLGEYLLYRYDHAPFS